MTLLQWTGIKSGIYNPNIKELLKSIILPLCYHNYQLSEAWEMFGNRVMTIQ